MGVEGKSNLIITKESTGSLTATGGGYGAAGESAEGRRCQINENTIISYKTGTIEIQGGNIRAVGGDSANRKGSVHLGVRESEQVCITGGTVRILGGTRKSRKAEEIPELELEAETMELQI